MTIVDRINKVIEKVAKEKNKNEDNVTWHNIAIELAKQLNDIEKLTVIQSSLQLKKKDVISFEEWKNRFVKETQTNNVYELKGDYVIGEDLITEYDQDVLLYESLIV